tara:strand:- start:6084 stop:6320 length:237 start_codon:yes stop_codon:yes gene_type:complete
MSVAPSIPKLDHGIFKSIYLQDWFIIHREAAEIYNEAIIARNQGRIVEYTQLMKRYDIYISSAGLIIDVAIKFPEVEA